MKFFVAALFVAVASAQPLWPAVVPTAYHTVNPYVVNPLVANPLVAAQPLVYSTLNLKPQVRPEYEVDEEKTPMVEPKKAEEDLKPVVYTNALGIQQAVVPVKVNMEVPARFVQKNGEVEKTTYVKRDADADPLMYSTLGAIPTVGAVGAIPTVGAVPSVATVGTPLVSSYAHAGLPLVNTYAHTGLVNPLINTYSAGLVASVPAVPAVAPAIAKPVADVKFTKPVVEEQAKTVANDQITPFVYSGKGTYAAVNEGAEHYAKRSADSDPAVLLTGNYLQASGYRTVSPYISSVYTTPYAARTVYGSPYLRTVSPYGLVY